MCQCVSIYVLPSWRCTVVECELAVEMIMRAEAARGPESVTRTFLRAVPVHCTLALEGPKGELLKQERVAVLVGLGAVDKYAYQRQVRADHGRGEGMQHVPGP